jgi:hypothetical protein
MTIPKDTMLEILYSDNLIEDKVVGTGRWSTHHAIVFAHDGRFYSAKYSVGATEYQEESPWEYQDMVECTEVRQVEEIVKVWKPVA